MITKINAILMRIHENNLLYLNTTPTIEKLYIGVCEVVGYKD